MKVSYQKTNVKKKVDDNFLTEAILNFTKKSKFPKQLLLNKINLLTQNNNGIKSELNIKIKKIQEMTNDIVSSKEQLSLKNKKTLQKLRAQIIN